MNRIYLPSMTLLAMAAALAGDRPSDAAEYDLFYEVPSLDRWMYPFNSEPGLRWEAPIFGSITTLEDGFDPSFDNRDGQMLIGFFTSTDVPVGLGIEAYHVSWVQVEVTVSNDLAWQYDPTPDPWQSWLPPDDPRYIPDEDPGRPLEMFATGFRNGYNATTMTETAPFCDCSCFPPNLCKAKRNAFGIDFLPVCSPEDVSNNVDGQFDPVPLAVGVIDGLMPGEFVPVDTVVTFVVDVGEACVQEYLAKSLDQGVLDFTIASIHFAQPMQAGGHPAIYCKEHPAVEFGFVNASQMELTARTGPLADLDDSGTVDTVDFLILLGEWGPCDQPCPPLCNADLNGDCVVDTVDFLTLLGTWGTTVN